MPPFLFLLLATVAAYLLGSLSFAMLSSRLFGLADPRSYGSGNPGATNVLRSGHKGAAVFTLLGDAGKGWLAVFLASRYTAADDLGSYAVGLVALAVFFGHLYPVSLGFKGGKGVATAAGVLLAINLWLGLAALGTGIDRRHPALFVARGIGDGGRGAALRPADLGQRRPGPGRRHHCRGADRQALAESATPDERQRTEDRRRQVAVLQPIGERRLPPLLPLLPRRFTQFPSACPQRAPDG